MKRIFIFVIMMGAFLTLSACDNSKKTYESLIVGNWETTAPMTVSEDGITITFTELNSTYNKNHISYSNGIMLISSSLFPQDLEMSIAIKANWTIEGDTLTETMTAADIKMKSVIPGIPDISEVIGQQMIAEGAKTSTILSLDAKTLVLEENESDLKITMIRQ
ncbi:MAG: hypothetical protein COA69_08285 [Robiginitomaculum sp.]|nr:MAG: hypothetical protein COA69_08285 [Robiginitomaculum sp.]